MRITSNVFVYSCHENRKYSYILIKETPLLLSYQLHTDQNENDITEIQNVMRDIHHQYYFYKYSIINITFTTYKHLQ